MPLRHNLSPAYIKLDYPNHQLTKYLETKKSCFRIIEKSSNHKRSINQKRQDHDVLKTLTYHETKLKRKLFIIFTLKITIWQPMQQFSAKNCCLVDFSIFYLIDLTCVA